MKGASTDKNHFNLWKIASIALLAIALAQTNTFVGKIIMNLKHNNSQIANRYIAPKTMQSQVKDIDRIHERDLDVTTFVDKYVKTGTPVIIDREEQSNQDEQMLSSLVNNCKHLSVPGIPLSVRNVLETLTDTQFKIASITLKLAVGLDFEKWMEDRRVITIDQIRQVASNQTSQKLPMPRFISWMLPSFVTRLLELFLRPLYLGDVVLTYEEAKQLCGITPYFTRQEEYAHDMLLRSKATIPQQAIWLFWGGIDSAYYPLHRDNSHGDVVVDVISGCKEFVIVHPDERHKLSKIPLPGSFIWEEDFFMLSDVTAEERLGIEKAWKGTISAGETLYMGGDSIHEARNNCPTTVSLSRRPWNGNSFRKINFPPLYL